MKITKVQGKTLIGVSEVCCIKVRTRREKQVLSVGAQNEKEVIEYTEVVDSNGAPDETLLVDSSILKGAEVSFTEDGIVVNGKKPEASKKKEVEFSLDGVNRSCEVVFEGEASEAPEEYAELLAGASGLVKIQREGSVVILRGKGLNLITRDFKPCMSEVSEEVEETEEEEAVFPFEEESESSDAEESEVDSQEVEEPENEETEPSGEARMSFSADELTDALTKMASVVSNKDNPLELTLSPKGLGLRGFLNPCQVETKVLPKDNSLTSAEVRYVDLATFSKVVSQLSETAEEITIIAGDTELSIVTIDGNVSLTFKEKGSYVEEAVDGERMQLDSSEFESAIKSTVKFTDKEYESVALVCTDEGISVGGFSKASFAVMKVAGRSAVTETTAYYLPTQIAKLGFNEQKVMLLVNSKQILIIDGAWRYIFFLKEKGMPISALKLMSAKQQEGVSMEIAPCELLKRSRVFTALGDDVVKLEADGVLALISKNAKSKSTLCVKKLSGKAEALFAIDKLQNLLSVFGDAEGIKTYMAEKTPLVMKDTKRYACLCPIKKS